MARLTKCEASVAHSETAAVLSDALDNVADAVEFAAVQARLIHSPLVRDAIAKLYVAIFLFFGEAIKWYKSSSFSKARKSLRNDILPNFRASVTGIEKLAADVRHKAQLGSQAEVRTIREGMESLQQQVAQLRQNIAQQIAAPVVGQRRPLDHEASARQALLDPAAPGLEWYRDSNLNIAARPSRSPVGYGRLLTGVVLEQDDETIGKLEPETQRITNEELADHVAALLKNDATEGGLFANIPQGTAVKRQFDAELSRVVNAWLGSQTPVLRYVEIGSLLSQQGGIHDLVNCVREVYSAAQQPVIVSSMQGNRTKRAESPSSLLFGLVYQVLLLLPPEDVQDRSEWKDLMDIKSASWPVYDIAASILARALKSAPPNIHVVLGNPPHMPGDGYADAYQMIVDMLRRLQSEAGGSALIIAEHRMRGLVPALRAQEIILLNSSRAGHSTEAPIVLRS
jgi:hypothetical protein